MSRIFSYWKVCACSSLYHNLVCLSVHIGQLFIIVMLLCPDHEGNLKLIGLVPKR